MTITMHIENTVHDFDSWKVVFDKFDRFRAERNVRACRVSRPVGTSDQAVVDLDFDSLADAEFFSRELEKIWSTPQSKAQLVSHGAPQLLDLVDQR